MPNEIDRRQFLRTARTAAVLAASTAAWPRRLQLAAGQAPATAGTKIGTASYTPVQDYPIRAKRFSDVTMKDAFWRPKIATNATVTIPFEVEKLTVAGRVLSGNVLEAAMLSLETHPDPALQRVVESSVADIAGRTTRRNDDFEAAATYFFTAGRHDLVDRAVKTADALYLDFQQHDPPFSGGERDAINCLQLYRVTHDPKHL
jgi:hypothetical protein